MAGDGAAALEQSARVCDTLHAAWLSKARAGGLELISYKRWYCFGASLSCSLEYLLYLNAAKEVVARCDSESQGLVLPCGADFHQA